MRKINLMNKFSFLAKRQKSERKSFAARVLVQTVYLKNEHSEKEKNVIRSRKKRVQNEKP
jgi:hypothetical protein